MFSVTVIAMGKLKEKFYIQAVEEYAKRLSGFCRLQLLELPEHRLPEDPSPAQIAEGLAREGQLIREKLPKGAWFCVLTPEGKKLSSEAFAETLAGVKTGGRSSACFLLGSSFGVAPEIKALADLKLSFSDMTFPHHLARIMLLEQLYRAENIQSHTRYHK
ncbi:MAG: 23S rRNA (pseudouridine(1915)-N(3))-methyltransferase RlmH [Oscillospiraceae bacterium]|nr:23S rRNA (pseudouridine(1915)-N(3))-methyltransferase RlmH [Oscillospiraceae bacterium]